MKIYTKTFIQAFTGFLVCVFFMAPLGAFAFEIQHAPEVPVENRFVVGPAKIEETISAGSNKTIFVEVENRTGRAQKYTVSFEDFVAGKNANETITLLGNEQSNTSLKKFFQVSSNEITLFHGDRVRVPVTISIPVGEIPGGKFGSVVVTANTTEINGSQSGATVLGRIATLVFVTVPGEIKTEGKVVSFQIARQQKIFFGSEALFQIAFENTGSVHLNPYGGIRVKNMFGHIVKTNAIDPWFVIPGSVRTREVTIQTSGLFGWYRAELELNPGYGDTINQKEVSFVVISIWAIVLIGLIVLVSIVLIVGRRKK